MMQDPKLMMKGYGHPVTLATLEQQAADLLNNPELEPKKMLRHIDWRGVRAMRKFLTLYEGVMADPMEEELDRAG